MLLDHLEKFGLQIQIQLADFIQEQGSSGSLCNQSLAASGKCAGLVAKELGFKQFSRNGAAVNVDERRPCPGTVAVDELCKTVLSGAGSAHNQYIGVSGRNAQRIGIQLNHAAVPGNDPLI